jgi:Na+/phosphate symporter
MEKYKKTIAATLFLGGLLFVGFLYESVQSREWLNAGISLLGVGCMAFSLYALYKERSEPLDQQ